MRQSRRRALQKSLPDTLTADEVSGIKAFFNGRCPISGSEANELDHFIPLVTGRGGTTKENTILLSKAMNSSKGGRNPFTWAENTLDEEEILRFYVVVHYLADINGLTYTEYEEYVNGCFDS